MKFNPTEGNVLVTFPKEEPKSESTIILSVESSKKELPSCGTVVKVGPSPKPTGFKEGDRVYFNKYAGIDLTLEGQKFNILKVEDIFGYDEL